MSVYAGYMTRIITLFLVCTVAGIAHAQSPQATLSRAITAYKNAETIQAHFHQTLTNPLTGSKSTTQGELFRRRPNLLAIVFSPPLTDRIIADGTSLWVYLPSSAPGQVIKMAANTAGAVLLDPLGQILSLPSDQYTLTDAGKTTVDSHATHAIKLITKGERQLFTQAIMWVDDTTGTVRQIETSEPSGLTRRIMITQLTTNRPLPHSTFTFTPPANARVIDESHL
jgi:outer membrane lipoprotein carrier protein